MSKVTLLAAAALALAACVPDPRTYETAPVQLQTAKGVLTCQLYTKELVVWDRSIDRPDGMSLKEADALCHQEGVRQQKS